MRNPPPVWSPAALRGTAAAQGATMRCDGGACELRLRAEAGPVLAVRFTFHEAPLALKVGHALNLVDSLE